MNIFFTLIITFLLNVNTLFSADNNSLNSSEAYISNNLILNSSGSPTDPINDRARGYLTKGKFQTAIINYGTFIDWDHNPSGLWGDYQYFPALGFVFGVPGSHYSHILNKNQYAENLGGWYNYETGPSYNIYKSTDAYYLWTEDGQDNFVGVVFGMETENEYAVFTPLGEDCVEFGGSPQDLFTAPNQYIICYTQEAVYISGDEELDLNSSNSRVGFIRPWAKRPAFKKRESSKPYRDEYEYGIDGEPWTADDEYVYYGSNVAESWFKGEENTDWQPTWGARGTIHNGDVQSGDIYGGEFTDTDDTYPLLATSTLPETWPKNTETGQPEWPGWYAEITQEGSEGGIDGNEAVATVGTFISDEDVYMEFDDRWAHRGNPIELGSDYENMGYPMGIKVKAMAHSYGVAFAEDVAFFTVKVTNESGNYVDENGIYHEGMTMPDGSKINGGNGFNYKNASMGFYFDVDSYSANADGSYGGRSNDDDMMGFDKDFRFAYIYDLDDNSYGATNLAYSAVKLLDTPLSSGYVDTDGDGWPDITPDDTLGMTDWHHFSWYARPGVLEDESGNPSCYGGSEGCPIAKNKEEIQFKLMTGDTTNLSPNEKEYYFHTDDMEADDHEVLNPHFDSMEGLLAKYDEGLDCVLMMSCGPFDLDVGEEVFFSFAVIMGQNLDDLRNNATMAQLMYDRSYQGFSPPATPEVYAVAEHEKVTLYWDSAAEHSRDRITNYQDFEGYRIYKSKDGGETWGDDAYDMIFDNDGIHVGWRPLAQFDLTIAEDNIKFGKEISGPDPLAPWFDLGSNTGLVHSFVDTDVDDGVQYTYAVTSYDMGVDADYEVVWNYLTDTLLIDTSYTIVEQLIPDEVDCLLDFGGGVTWPNGTFTDLDQIAEYCTDLPSSQCDFCDTTISHIGQVEIMHIDSIDAQFGFYASDTIYNIETNPDHWASPHGLVSLETSKGTSFRDKNYVEVTPGFKPTNVSNPIPEEGEDPFQRLNAFGNGQRLYTIVNEESHDFEVDRGLNDDLYLYTILADNDPTSYQNMDLSNPSLFVYQVELNGNEYIASDKQEKTIFIYEMNIDIDTIDSIIDTSLVLDSDGNPIFNDNKRELSYPGTEIVSENISTGEIQIIQPNYALKDYKILDNGMPNYEENWSEFHNGLTINFGNPYSNVSSPFFNKINSVQFDITGDSSCVSLYLSSYTQVEKFYDYEIHFGVESPSYLPVQPWENFDIPTESGNVTIGQAALCLANLIENDWKYPFTIINTTTGNEVFLTSAEDEFNPEDIIKFFEIDVTDSTYYYHQTEDCELLAFKTYNFNLDIFSLPYSHPLCPHYSPCCDEPNSPMLEPWESGDKITIETSKSFLNGDSWILDMSKFGNSRDVTKEDLEMIKVVPNPYIVRSGMDETKSSKRMAFTQLPEKCKIKIYTVTGELIRELNHDDTYLGTKFWDLRTSNNQEVAPGLYIYTVEADNVKHISKFAIVR